MWTDDHDREYVHHGPLTASLDPAQTNMATAGASPFDPAQSTWPQQVHLHLHGFSIPFSASLPTSPLTAVVSWEEVYDADATRTSLEWVYRELIAITFLNELEPAQEEAVECVWIALQSITAITEDECHSSHSASVVNLDPRYLASDGSGRSRFDIGEEQLLCLIEIGFCFAMPEIASILGASISTVRRCMNEYNLSVSATCSDIGDDELDHCY